MIVRSVRKIRADNEQTLLRQELIAVWRQIQNILSSKKFYTLLSPVEGGLYNALQYVRHTMYLKSLEIAGFKSFARKATLSFSSPITAIVGPNGSGKSNTAEAFRFVLGEQSIKSLRGKRGEDMIWNGAADNTRANRASVKLVFENDKRLFPNIDFNEVSLERVVHRDNTNEYLLNGSQVRLKDIIELLAGAHIGATGHHIISQGEADRILSASIRERREMIEDALGLKIYQWKKLESLRKLEKTEENMKQVESLRREIAPHLKFLKKQAEKVEKAAELRRELVDMYKQYFASEDRYLRQEKSRIESALAEPKKESSELERELDRAKKILIDSKGKDGKSDSVITIESKLKTIRAEKDALMREAGRIEGEISANRRAITKEEARVRSDESRTVYLKDVEAVLRKVEGMSAIDDVKRLWNEVVLVLRTFISGHRDSTDSSVIADAEREIVSLSKDKSDLESKLRRATEEEFRQVREYDELKSAIEKEKDTNREAEKDVFRIIARQNELRGRVSSLEAELAAIVRGEESFKRELGEAGIIAGREAVDYKATAAMGNLVDIGAAARDELRKKIERSKIRLEDSGSAGGAEVMKEYKETEERDMFLMRELEDLEKAKGELKALVADLDARIDFEFKNGILKINSEFQKYFSMMFGGGKAELVTVKEVKRRKKEEGEQLASMLVEGVEYGGSSAEEVDREVDGPEGIDVNVNLPRKKVKGLMMLSGGERALTSIALLFAISQVNPPPFIILDETDAALDEANSKKYGDMIADLSKHSQLILITHNRETMSRAGVLYGVTMGSDGASRLLSIAFDDAVVVAK